MPQVVSDAKRDTSIFSNQPGNPEALLIIDGQRLFAQYGFLIVQGGFYTFEMHIRRVADKGQLAAHCLQHLFRTQKIMRDAILPGGSSQFFLTSALYRCYFAQWGVLQGGDGPFQSRAGCTDDGYLDFAHFPEVYEKYFAGSISRPQSHTCRH